MLCVLVGFKSSPPSFYPGLCLPLWIFLQLSSPLTLCAHAHAHTHTHMRTPSLVVTVQPVLHLSPQIFTCILLLLAHRLAVTSIHSLYSHLQSRPHSRSVDRSKDRSKCSQHLIQVWLVYTCKAPRRILVNITWMWQLFILENYKKKSSKQKPDFLIQKFS